MAGVTLFGAGEVVGTDVEDGVTGVGFGVAGADVGCIGPLDVIEDADDEGGNTDDTDVCGDGPLLSLDAAGDK